MSDMYKRIEELCKSRGVNITQMCKNAGVARAPLTELKMGRTAILSAKNADKIAKYFNVSVGYLLGTDSDPEQKETPLVNGDEELTEYLEMLKTRPEIRMLFQLSKDATKEDVEKAVAIIEAIRK